MKLTTVTIANLKPHPNNPNTHPANQLTALGESLDTFDQVKNVVVWNGTILAGHGVIEAAQKTGRLTLEAMDVSHWNEDKATAFMLADIRLPALAFVDDEAMSAVLAAIDQPLDIPGIDAGFLEDIGLSEPKPPPETEPQVDKAEELREEWGTELGQIWQIGPHRLAVGDCTDREVVGALMGEELTALVHADPPYGMGKEKDGIANDNLYRDKLDNFQMQWWKACRPSIEDNGSVYIWGNAEDLWRLWYVGGLKDSERLTFRNEIVWDKGDAGAGGISHQGAEGFRMYPNGSERCLFFMLGEQGFNNNADNYWEGWEPIRAYIDGERLKMGWSRPDYEKVLGSTNKSQHHLSKSYFNLITETDYQKLQQAAKSEAFKRDYEELKRDYEEIKRDFYATRAYFDNTHDNMTDVWQFPRVTGEERWEHATPKPVQMIERIIKSSSPDNALILDPFLGSGTTMIAAHNLDRRCYGIEISPAYAAVTLQRLTDHTGIKPELT